MVFSQSACNFCLTIPLGTALQGICTNCTFGVSEETLPYSDI